MLVDCAVVSVTGKAVRVVQNDDVKYVFFAVVDHSLKLSPVVRLARNLPVNIGSNDSEVMQLGVLRTLSDLSLDRLLCLIWSRAVPGVYHCSLHGITSGRRTHCDRPAYHDLARISLA